MKVITIPVLNDNYSYLLINQDKSIAAAIDPVEPTKVLDAAKKEGVEVTMILTTHHHMDHSGGNAAFLKLKPNIKVYGGDERIIALNSMVSEGETIEIGDSNLSVKVFKTPCHTTGHVLYLAKDTTDIEGTHQSLFTGDTLFVSGCGRFFEGDSQQMDYALNTVIGKLNPNTKVYCGHEYTVKNLEFAQTIEKDNNDLNKKLEWARKQIQEGKTTIPSTIGEELTYNPFMRVHRKDFETKFPGITSPVDIMGQLRKLKDSF